jgi:hypothetical protein
MSYRIVAFFLIMLLVIGALYGALRSVSLIAQTCTASNNACSRTVSHNPG